MSNAVVVLQLSDARTERERETEKEGERERERGEKPLNHRNLASAFEIFAGSDNNPKCNQPWQGFPHLRPPKSFR